MKEDRTSTVMVKKLDMTEQLALATDRWNSTRAKEDHLVALVPYNDVGIVETSEGLFAFLEEGVGSDKPVTDENPFELVLYGKSETGLSIIPVCSCDVNAEDLRQFPYEEVNLAHFIRRFGHRLECNFNEWNRALAPIWIES